jgi:hypothetical protein
MQLGSRFEAWSAICTSVSLLRRREKKKEELRQGRREGDPAGKGVKFEPVCRYNVERQRDRWNINVHNLFPLQA